MAGRRTCVRAAGAVVDALTILHEAIDVETDAAALAVAAEMLRTLAATPTKLARRAESRRTEVLLRPTG